MLEEVQPNSIFFRAVIQQNDADFAICIVEIVIAVLLSKKKDWPLILHSFFRSWFNSVGAAVDGIVSAVQLMRTENNLKDILSEGSYFTIGRSPVCDIVVLDPLVEELHASLHKQGNRWVIQSESEHRPVWLHGKPVLSYPMVEKQSVFLGPIELWIEDDSVHLCSHRIYPFSPCSLCSDGSRTFTCSKISLSKFFREKMIALVGPSGAGKKQHLNAINATAPADSGKVLLDGADFHRLLNQDRSLIGIVPQDDRFFQS